MKHLFVPYEIALVLKHKGFDEPCLGWWWKNGDIFYSGDIAVQYLKDNASSNGCSAPLFQQVVDWFREKHKIYISNVVDLNTGLYAFQVSWHDGMKWNEIYPKGGEYYEALTEAINHAITLI